MNKNELRTQLKDLTEQKAPAAQIDLWPALQARLPMNQPESMRGTIVNNHSPLPSRRWKPAYLLLIVFSISALFFAFPQGRAMGQAVLRFFQRGESNLMPGVTVTPVQWVEQTPGVAAATITPLPTQPVLAFEAVCGSFQVPRCTVEEIRGMVSFPVFALPNPPEGMRFIGATGGPDQVHLFYETPNQTGNLIIWQEPRKGDGSRQAWKVGADAVIEQVQVGGDTAEYVKGSYDGSSNPPVWNAILNVQVLRWVHQGVLINLQMLGTEPRLGRNDLAALAATLTDTPTAVTDLPVEEAVVEEASTATEKPIDLYPMTYTEVEEQAGFRVQSPSQLPEYLVFDGAAFDDASHTVILHFRYHDTAFPENTNGLRLRQAVIPETGTCPICGFVVGQYNGDPKSASGEMIGENTVIQSVPIGNITGQYVEGVWYGTEQGWVFDTTSYVKTLRWQSNGMAFELLYFGEEISQADLIAIAASV